MLKNMLMKLIGKKLDAKMEKMGVSKAKVIAVVGVILYAIQALSGPVFNHPIEIPTGVLEILASLGLWSMRDGSNTDAVLSASASLNKELDATLPK